MLDLDSTRDTKFHGTKLNLVYSILCGRMATSGALTSTRSIFMTQLLRHLCLSSHLHVSIS